MFPHLLEVFKGNVLIAYAHTFGLDDTFLPFFFRLQVACGLFKHLVDRAYQGVVAKDGQIDQDGDERVTMKL